MDKELAALFALPPPSPGIGPPGRYQAMDMGFIMMEDLKLIKNFLSELNEIQSVVRQYFKNLIKKNE